MTGYEYEQVVARYLQRHGYYGVQVTRGSGDFGVDIIAHRGFTKYAVQCKYYSSPVSLVAVQEVVAGKAYYGCAAAMVVTNSTFTAAARELATQNGVRLVERVNGFGFGIPTKWLAIAAGLYTLFVIAPVTSAIYDHLKENHSLREIIGSIGGFAIIAFPFWALPALRLLCRLAVIGLSRLIEYLKNRKNNVQLVHRTAERALRLESRAVIDPSYTLALVDDPEAPECDEHFIKLAKEAVVACADQKHISASLIQRRCGISFDLAKKVIQILMDRGLIEIDARNQYAYEWTEKAEHNGSKS